MNNPLTWVVLTLALGGATIGYLNMNSVEEFTNPKPEVETVEVHPEWSTDEEAVAAAQAVIQRKAWEAELEAVEANFEAVTATFEADKAAYIEKKTQLEKNLGSY